MVCWIYYLHAEKADADVFSLYFLSCSPRQINSAVRITLSTVGSLQALGLNGGHWRWPLSKLNCFTPLRVKKIDSKGPFLVRVVIIDFGWRRGKNTNLEIL